MAAGAIHAFYDAHAGPSPAAGGGGTGLRDIDLVVATEEAEQAALAALIAVFGEPHK